MLEQDRGIEFPRSEAFEQDAGDRDEVGAQRTNKPALQTTAIEPRVRGVIAHAPFSNLDTIVHERVPGFAPLAVVNAALTLAGERAGFRPKSHRWQTPCASLSQWC